MAKHAAPHAPIRVVLASVGAGFIWAAGTCLIGTPPILPYTATTAANGDVCYDLHGGTLCAEDQPQVRTVPVGGVEVGDGSYDLTHEDTGAVTCWVEKAQDVATAEGICGPRGLRPAGSVELGTEVTLNGQPWVATVTGLEPVGAN
jgi:hypothetical protein